MKRIIRIAAAVTLVGILLLEFQYVDEIVKKDEQDRTERKIALDSIAIVYKAEIDSLLARDSMHIDCVKCGWRNDKTLLWFKDSMP